MNITVKDVFRQQGTDSNGLSDLLGMIRNESAVTRSDLVARTGLSRLAVAQHLSVLLRSGLIVENGQEASTGGRRRTRFGFNTDAGYVLAFDVGISHARVALANLGARIIDDVYGELSVDQGPEIVLSWFTEQAEQLLGQAKVTKNELWGIGVGLPGPVDVTTGQVVSPPFMTGWDGFPTPEWLRDRFGCPVVVDKDANVMALGEHRSNWREVDELLFLKVGTGVGGGVVIEGKVYHGADGAAGDIGHVPLHGYGEPTCRCGNVGCVEAIAGGWALARDLAELGYEISHGVDVALLAKEGNVDALRAIRRAGRVVGEALAAAVNFYNPEVVVVGGSVARGQGEFLAGIRETVYRRSLTLATRKLSIVSSRLEEKAGIVGCAHLAIERALTPGVLAARIK